MVTDGEYEFGSAKQEEVVALLSNSIYTKMIQMER